MTAKSSDPGVGKLDELGDHRGADAPDSWTQDQQGERGTPASGVRCLP